MHGYRLTRRGKFALMMIVMLVSIAGTLGLKNIAVASDKSEYLINNSSYLSSPNSEFDELDLIKSAVAFNLVMRNSDINEKEGFLSISVEDIKSYNKSKVAFLTFDDGPTENITPVILDILDEYNIKATFFVLGSMCERNDVELNDIYKKGHSIGIHSYTHDFNHLYKNEENFLNELKMTQNVLKQKLGEEFNTRLFRFPGGSFEGYKSQYMDALNEAGYVSIDWNAVTGDTEMLNPTPEKLLNRLKLTTKNKNNIVVLMHDSATKQVMAETLPDVIEYLKSDGYEFAILK